ncbi:MAG TPA: fatty acid desaturase [Thermoanaerobaculia bacterium]|jgi:fatty acid desaturase|nr:fatty acid desaturase [Thermoanaerobaculia bacterium]
MLTIGKPLDGMDLGELSKVKVWPFLLRTLIFFGLIAGFVAIIVLTGGVLPWVAMVGLGLIYAHGVELQHQALHNSAFPSKFWNRIVGFFMGLPLLVSFSDYQYSHLRHHRLLGTGDDREFFNYGYNRLTSLKPLLKHLFMVRHYLDVTGFIANALLGRVKPDVKHENAVKIRTEYQWMGVFIVAAVAVSVIFKTTVLLKVWFLPLLVGIPTHALIELPEHWGRNHDTLDVRENTRTIHTGWFATWFTNGNNYHIEHHWLPSVPNDKLPDLHRQISNEIDIDTYPKFFRRFLTELYRNTFTRRGPEASANA